MIKIQAAQTGQGANCRQIIDQLSSWFGRPDVNEGYVQYTEDNPTYVAFDDDKPVGFLSLAQHNPQSAEIHVLGIIPDYHRQGIGRQLVAAAEDDLCQTETRFLQVKTLGPSHPMKEYVSTRAFYVGVGFTPLEEIQDFWGKGTPCLIQVKVIE